MVNERRPRVVGYLRTSTDDGRQADSPIVQEAKLKEACERRNWELAKCFDDGRPGKTPFAKRPQFQRLLEFAEAEAVDGIVVISFDRIIRSGRLLFGLEEILEEAELFIYGIDDDLGLGQIPGKPHRMRAMDWMRLNMKVMVDQSYSDFITDKVRDKQEYRVFQQKLHSGGNPPFGYMVKRGVPHPETGKACDMWWPDDQLYGDPSGPLGQKTGCEWARWIFRRFIECESMQQVALELNEAKVPTPRLIQWNRLTPTEQERRLEAQAERSRRGEQTRTLPPSPYWDSSVESEMLRSRSYLGEISYTPDYKTRKDSGRKTKPSQKRWHPGVHQAIIDLDTFDKVQAILASNKDRRSPGSRGEVLLSGLLRCCCNLGVMTRTGGHHKDDDFNYACNFNRKTRGLACTNPRKSAKAVHHAARQLLVIGLLRQREIFLKNPPVGKSDDEALNRAIDTKTKEVERIRKMTIAGLFDTEEQGFAELARAKAELEALQQSVLRVAHDVTTVDEIDALILQLDEVWAHLDLAHQPDLLRTYAPQGFILDYGVLKAKVCGVPISVEVRKEASVRKDSLAGHYSTHQAAERLGVTRQAVVAMIKRGALPVERVPTGKLMKQYIPCEAVDAIVAR